MEKQGVLRKSAEGRRQEYKNGKCSSIPQTRIVTDDGQNFRKIAGQAVHTSLSLLFSVFCIAQIICSVPFPMGGKLRVRKSGRIVVSWQSYSRKENKTGINLPKGQNHFRKVERICRLHPLLSQENESKERTEVLSSSPWGIK